MAAVVQQQRPPSAQPHAHIPATQLNQILQPHMSPPLQLPPVQPRLPTTLPPPPASTPGPTTNPPPSSQSSTAPHHHHHLIVHTHQQTPASSSKGPNDEARERDATLTTASAASTSSPGKKRPRVVLEEASILAADDKAEWYYPAAPRPATLVDSEDEPELEPGHPSGNWGHKYIKGARWVRRGKIASWGAGKVEWEMEDRARKRLKRLLPDRSPPSSPPLPTLPHLREATPPLEAPYYLPPKNYPSYTSLLVDQSVQHTYTNNTVSALEGTATEFIEGEGALRIALGALWQAMAPDYISPEATSEKQSEEAVASGRPSEAAESVKQGTDVAPTLPNGLQVAADARMSSPSASTVPDPYEDLLISSLTPLKQLFISANPVTIGPDHAPIATLKSANQLESYEWAITMLRDLADDAREYMGRLEEIRERSGQALAVRHEVWKTIKEKALEELEESDEQEEEAEGDDRSEF